MEFVLGGVSACGACLFTNPLEVVKIRLQLQGELQAKGVYQVHYKNVFHAFLTLLKHDGGVSALQKGLVPAMWYQLVMNGCRLGTYQSLLNSGLIHNPRNGQIVFWRSVVAGAFAGAVGALVSSPFFLVKTHLQSRAATSIAVGHQHQVSSMMQAYGNIYSSHGFLALWRGVSGAIPRVTVGSAAQLATFSSSLELMNSMHKFSYPWMAPLFASLVSGVAVVACFTPFDVISTRLYNQPVCRKTGKGLVYAGIYDCGSKIIHTEGIGGMYKGWAANYLRVGPHTVLSLVFWNELRRYFL